MQNMETVLDSVIVLNELRENIKEFLTASYDDFVKSGYEKLTAESQKKKTNSPFLSIVIRTQGRREESLREVFLCLEGQENQDFEVLLCGHKLNEEQKELVHKIMAQQGESLRKKIRYIAVDDGNRTTPLNIGFAKAWGEYIVTLDDDDIVLDHWVSNFYHAAQKHYGKVLYNYTFAQDWSVIEEGDYAGGLRTESGFDTEFAKDYNAVTQVGMNCCPAIGLAYPAAVFQKMGMIFDESLATTEDWDYLMRAAYICGVYSIPMPACIYRKWMNADNSFTVHSKEEWAKNYDAIVGRITSKMLCLPVGGAKTIYSLLKDGKWLMSQTNIESVLQDERIYFKSGGFYSEEDTLHASRSISQSGEFELIYMPGRQYCKMTEMRWDPIEKGILLLKALQVRINYCDDSALVLGQADVKHNGKDLAEYILFMQDDPQVEWSSKKGKDIRKITIRGILRVDIPLELCDMLLKKRSAVRAKDIVKRIKKNVFG